MKTIKKPNLKGPYQIISLLIFLGSIAAIIFIFTEFKPIIDEYNILIAILVLIIPIATLAASIYFLYKEGGKDE